ncbi:MAG: hypothetical protein LBR06_07040, partial [Bacteroidales bacterium]|nr:hypothetical protein [Bacteroidales bacterium]
MNIKLLLSVLSVAAIVACRPNNTVRETVSKHKAVFTAPPKRIPTKYSVDAPVMGNGFMGAAIGGKP